MVLLKIKKIDNKIKIKNNIFLAKFSVTLLQANGLIFFFNGCNLSDSKSQISFIMYTIDAERQNIKKTIKIFKWLFIRDS